MKRTITLLLSSSLILLSTCIVKAQDVDSLKSRINDLQSQVKTLESEIKKTQELIPPTYGWSKGFIATLGFNSTYLDNWQLNPNPNSTTMSIMASINAFANLKNEKQFWRNNATVSLGYQRQTLDRNDPDSPKSLEPTVDVFQINSLYGRKINDKLAYSGMGEVRATILENRFDPGYVDLGVGITWTPIPNLVAVFHPINYNFIIASEDLMYESSPGTKIVVDYNQEVFSGMKLRSNLSGFGSYTEFSELSNFTWTTGISFTAFKGIGVGLEYSLRWSPQETRMIEAGDIQNYFLLGLTYSL